MPRRAALVVLLFLLAACGDGGGHDAGDPDDAFRGDGSFTIDFDGRYDFSTGIVLQPDRMILVAATSCGGSPPNCAFALARIRPNGKLDKTFGERGLVTTNLGPFGGAEAHAIALQPDGKIVLAGLVRTDRFVGNPSSLALARYEPDGDLDPSFGTDGTVVTPYRDDPEDLRSSQFNAVFVLPDGRLLAAGFHYSPFDEASSMLLARYAPDGTLDPTFGTNGIATANVGRPSIGYAAALQRSGRIVVGGSFITISTNEPALVGFDPDGHVDERFGDHGVVTFDLGDQALFYGLVTTADDGLIAATPDALRRVDADGRHDPTFHGDTLGYPFIVSSLAVQDDGRLLVSGTARAPNDASDGFYVARLHPDGTIDPTFGAQGFAITRTLFITDGARSFVALQPDGDPVVATVVPRESADLLMLRYRGGP